MRRVGTRGSDKRVRGNLSLAVNLADKRVVTIGGGTGPFALLSTLKHYPCAITAIVTMADSGGSSRRLMDEFGQLPFGDLRQALVALAQRGALWRDLFNFRFRSGEAPSLPVEEAADASKKLHLLTQCPTPTPQGGVGGHSLGNLILSALEEMNEGNLLWALDDAHELLGIAGHARACNTLRRALYG